MDAPLPQNGNGLDLCTLTKSDPRSIGNGAFFCGAMGGVDAELNASWSHPRRPQLALQQLQTYGASWI